MLLLMRKEPSTRYLRVNHPMFMAIVSWSHVGNVSMVLYASEGAFMQQATCDIGLIGLAVMGQNLVLNMNDHGYKVAVFNRTTSKVDEFLADEARGPGGG